MGILRRGAIKSVVKYRLTLGWYDHLIECTKDLDDIKILDVGGEAPTITHLLKDKNITLHIMDLPEMCKLGRKEYPETKYFEDLKLVDADYDIITSYSSIRYARSITETLDIFQCLSPKYIVFGHVVCSEKETYIIEQNLASQLADSQGVYRVCNIKDIVKCLPNFSLITQKEYPINYDSLKKRLDLKQTTEIKCMNFYFRNKEL